MFGPADVSWRRSATVCSYPLVNQSMNILAALPVDIKRKVVAYLPVGPPKAFLADIKTHAPKSYTICDACKRPTTVPGFCSMTWSCRNPYGSCEEECTHKYCEFCFENHFPSQRWECPKCLNESPEDWYPWYTEMLYDIGI